MHMETRRGRGEQLCGSSARISRADAHLTSLAQLQQVPGFCKMADTPKGPQSKVQNQTSKDTVNAVLITKQSKAGVVAHPISADTWEAEAETGGSLWI